MTFKHAKHVKKSPSSLSTEKQNPPYRPHMGLECEGEWEAGISSLPLRPSERNFRLVVNRASSDDS